MDPTDSCLYNSWSLQKCVCVILEKKRREETKANSSRIWLRNACSFTPGFYIEMEFGKETKKMRQCTVRKEFHIDQTSREIHTNSVEPDWKEAPPSIGLK